MNTFIKKITLLILSSVFIISTTQAQLNKVCPISSVVYNKQALKNTNLLLNTKDFTPLFQKNGKTKTSSSVQLVNVNQPFPPLWFQMGNPEVDTTGFNETSFLLDLRMQRNSGHLTYFSSMPDSFFGTVTIDTATLKPIYTLSNYAMRPEDMMMLKIDLHDLDVDKDGNRLFANQLQRKINVTCLSGLEADSARMAVVNDIIILNPNDSVIFRWNPLEHLSACEMHWEYKNSSLDYGDVINWSHVNSVKFANDGNILYSFRHIGVGKINRKTGEIMWKLGGKDSSFAIPINDSDGYYLQHDFLQLKNGLYSVFSNGDSTHNFLEGINYKIDEINNKATVVRRYKPEPTIYSKALGSYDCKGDTCTICFGMYYPDKKDSITQEAGQILIGNKLVASISTPSNNFAYQIHTTKWSALQRRPKISINKNTLYVKADSDLINLTWYKIEKDKAIPVGLGEIFTPKIAGKYVVEAQLGTDFLKSYLVSDVFDFSNKKK